MRKIIKDIIGWVVYVAVLVGLIYGIPKGLAFALKTEYPMAAITSGSMWPTLKKGDLVLIKGVTNKEEVKIGDIIVYRNPQGFTIHRIVSTNETTIITKGDANNVSDAPVSYDEIIGKTLTFNNKPLRIPLLGNVSILINKNKMNAK
jgi:signal peptidase